MLYILFFRIETGLHDFVVGVSESSPTSTGTFNEAIPQECASYVGNVQNEKQLLLNCSTVRFHREYLHVFVSRVLIHISIPYGMGFICIMKMLPMRLAL